MLSGIGQNLGIGLQDIKEGAPVKRIICVSYYTSIPAEIGILVSANIVICCTDFVIISFFGLLGRMWLLRMICKSWLCYSDLIP